VEKGVQLEQVGLAEGMDVSGMHAPRMPAPQLQIKSRNIYSAASRPLGRGVSGNAGIVE
jgi:hypothetical protein